MNVLIVNHNTELLVNALILNLENYGTFNIFIVDNSDGECMRVVETKHTIHFIDNTDDSYINYREEFEKVNTNKSLDCGGSFIHACTIQKFYDSTEEPFLLLDSDVILRKNPSEFIDTECLYSGEKSHNRIMPMVLYINTPKCKSKGIRFFDGRTICPIEPVDTGYVFFKDCEGKGPSKNFRILDVASHLGGSSYKMFCLPNYETVYKDPCEHSTKLAHQRFVYDNRAFIPNMDLLAEYY